MADADTIVVKPVPDCTLPVEGSGANRRVIDKQMTVQNTAYYRRAIARGDIELVSGGTPS